MKDFSIAVREITMEAKLNELVNQLEFDDPVMKTLWKKNISLCDQKENQQSIDNYE
jgi:chorismate mutase